MRIEPMVAQANGPGDSFIESARAVVRVTVILPTFNFGQYVGQAIRSILDQTFKDFELLVFDNGSTDDTSAVVATFTDQRLHFRVNETNVGLFGSVQRGIDAAKGKYFVIVGADDVLEPTFLEESVRTLDSDPSLSLLHGAAIWIDENGMPFGSTNDEWRASSNCHQAFVDVFRLGFCLTTIVARTELVRQMPSFHPSWNVMNDVWLILRMALVGNLGYLHKPLVRYRVHSKSLSITGYRSGDFFRQQLRIVREAFEWPESRVAELHRHRNIALRCVALGAIRILHSTRATQSRWFYVCSAARIVRSVPSALLSPEIWARFGLGMMPRAWIERISHWRRKRWRDASPASYVPAIRKETLP